HFRARAQSVVAEAAHRAGTTGVEVLEERQARGGERARVVRGIGQARVAGAGGGVFHGRAGPADVADDVVAIAVAVTQVQAGAQHVRRAQPPVLGNFIVELEVLDR